MPFEPSKQRVHLVQDIEYAPIGRAVCVFRLTSINCGSGDASHQLSTVEGLARTANIEAFCAGTGPAPTPLDGWMLAAPEYPSLLQQHGYNKASRVMTERGLAHPEKNRIYTELVENGYPLDLLVTPANQSMVFNRYGKPLPQVYRCNLVTGLSAVYEDNTIQFDARLSEGRKVTDWKSAKELLRAHPQVQFVKAVQDEDDEDYDSSDRFDYFLFTPTAEQEAALWEKQESYVEHGAWRDKGRALFDLDLLGWIAAGVLVETR